MSVCQGIKHCILIPCKSCSVWRYEQIKTIVWTWAADEGAGRRVAMKALASISIYSVDWQATWRVMNSGKFTTPSDGDSLIAGVCNGDLASVQQLLCGGVDVNYRDPVFPSVHFPSNSPLNHHFLVQNSFGFTPLHHACWRPEDPVTTTLVSLLLDMGAVVDVQDDVRSRALFILDSKLSQMSICSSFQFGYTPLHYACITGRRKVGTKLLEHGANPSIKNKVTFLSVLWFAILFSSLALSIPASLPRNISVQCLTKRSISTCPFVLGFPNATVFHFCSSAYFVAPGWCDGPASGKNTMNTISYYCEFFPSCLLL